jgi:hypothetical protein
MTVMKNAFIDRSKTALVVIDLQKGIVGRQPAPHAPDIRHGRDAFNGRAELPLCRGWRRSSAALPSDKSRQSPFATTEMHSTVGQSCRSAGDGGGREGEAGAEQQILDSLVPAGFAVR